MTQTDVILEARGISKALEGRTILADCSLSVRRGELKVLIGPSGAGKSTLLQCINCLIRPDRGEILLEGQPLDMANKKALCAFRAQVGMIFQDFNLFDHLTAEENVAIALRKVRGMRHREAKERARDELARVGLARRALLYPAQLSGGQKQRVAIAGVLAMGPRVLVLDEPTAMLDPQGRREVLSTVTRLCREQGMTVVLITHHMEECVEADRLLVMSDGRIAADGRPVEVFAQVALMEREGLDVPETTRLLYELDRRGYPMALDTLDIPGCADQVAAFIKA